MTRLALDTKHPHAGAVVPPRKHPAPDHADDGASMPGSTVLLDMLVAASRLNSALQRGMADLLDGAELNLLQWLMLCHLRHAAAGTLTEVAAALSRDTGGLSRTAQLLRRRQLIEVTRGTQDRRSVQLSITPVGLALCESVDHRMRKRLVGTLSAALGPQSLQTLSQLMEGAATSLNNG
ncbi:MarR family transcriptional regulator [uncultured Ralstonia sp.]|uniref:MarR family winged helix-turn-helix transcriptional regulator n=1 Tax=Ralstonia sp. TaxID=54061 RepID=UPI001EAA03C2|nr:MarR family transcriptional regulator [uncultured Ralstonia sp.]UCF23098.1 MAG: MarR family transcriptional regulator [Ralstonia sp.]